MNAPNLHAALADLVLGARLLVDMAPAEGDDPHLVHRLREFSRQADALAAVATRIGRIRLAAGSPTEASIRGAH